MKINHFGNSHKIVKDKQLPEKEFQRIHTVTEKILQSGRFPDFSGINLPHVYYFSIIVILMVW